MQYQENPPLEGAPKCDSGDEAFGTDSSGQVMQLERVDEEYPEHGKDEVDCRKDEADRDENPESAPPAKKKASTKRSKKRHGSGQGHGKSAVNSKTRSTKHKRRSKSGHHHYSKDGTEIPLYKLHVGPDGIVDLETGERRSFLRSTSKGEIKPEIPVFPDASAEAAARAVVSEKESKYADKNRIAAQKDAKALEQAPQIDYGRHEDVMPELKDDGPKVASISPGEPQVTAQDRGEFAEPRHERGVLSNQGLAVALAVDEEQEQTERQALPSAQEFDPESKQTGKPIYKHKHFKWWVLVGVVVLIGVVVGVSVGVTRNNDNDNQGESPTASPTVAPTLSREGELSGRFQNLIGDEVFESGNPANMATRWIVDEDPMQLDASAPNVDQRFLLAYFYYFTTQQSPWRSCGKAQDDEESTCMYGVLQFGQNGEQSYSEKQSFRWLSAESECLWAGDDDTRCSEDGVVRIVNMLGQEITGSLPPFLSKLPFLQSIGLAYNKFTGTIPEEYGELRELQNVELHYNGLTGPISPNLYKISTLVRFNVAANDLSGPIAGTQDFSISNWANLQQLYIFENKLTGVFPSEIGELTDLVEVRALRNRFDRQPIPTELGKLGRLQTLWLGDNVFTGTIPSDIGLATSLSDFRVEGNVMTGAIPDQLYNLTNLEVLRLDANNGLSGTLSPLIGRLSELFILRVEENPLTGPIPSELGLLKKLNQVFLHRTQLTGAVPSEICENVACIDQFGVGLQFLNADCQGANIANECACCTGCCDRDSPTSCSLTGFLDC